MNININLNNHESINNSGIGFYPFKNTNQTNMHNMSQIYSKSNCNDISTIKLEDMR